MSVPCELPFSRFPERDRYPIAVACLERVTTPRSSTSIRYLIQTNQKLALKTDLTPNMALIRSSTILVSACSPRKRVETNLEAVSPLVVHGK